MDALYPHDRGLKLEVLEGMILVYSGLGAGELLELLKRYPVRSILRVRRIVAHSEGGLEEALEELFARAARTGLKVSSVEVRARGLAERRKVEAAARAALRSLGLFDAAGVRARLLLLPAPEGGYRALLAV